MMTRESYKHEVAVDERRHAVVRIQIQQVFGQIAVVDVDDVDSDALLGQARAVSGGSRDQQASRIASSLIDGWQ